MLALDFRNRNILFWQDGELLVNRVATRLRASVELDRAQRTLTLHDALLGINGTELDLTGTVRRDTAAAGALLLDLRYGLHVPSLETVLHMIPESVLKRGEVAADGEVRISGAVKGPYGRQALPLATLDAEIKDASAHYAGMPTGWMRWMPVSWDRSIPCAASRRSAIWRFSASGVRIPIFWPMPR